MVQKSYDWTGGAVLGEHSKRKHKILREYFYKYLKVKCVNPQQSNFRLAIIDGFSGGGRYQCGSPGSPLIFIEELKRAYEDINKIRSLQKLKAIEFDCLIICNDTECDAIESLKKHIKPYQDEIAEVFPGLKIQVDYFSCKFEELYYNIKPIIQYRAFANVIFNLDQCGYTHVSKEIITDIMDSFKSAEIFYTFMVDGLLKYAPRSDFYMFKQRLTRFEISDDKLRSLSVNLNKNEWLGAVEQMVFENFKTCSRFLTPFSINHSGGYRYWLMHFSKNYRARQEYNNVLHDNANFQAHYGRAGLDMLSYNPAEEGTLYLFDQEARIKAKLQLYDDVPRYISKTGGILIKDFYANIYNNTPAHSDDINYAIIKNPDIEVLTNSGGFRRKFSTIKPNDVIKLKDQKSFKFF